MLAALVIGCGANGHITEETFEARTDDENDAIERIRYWVGVVDTVLADESVSPDKKAKLRGAIADARSALAAYSRLRDQGQWRGMIIAPIQVSAAGIVADDATGVGVANDVLLVPLALAAIATYTITDARAAQHELTRAWNDVLARVAVLGTTVDDIVHLTAKGRVSDSGIEKEMFALIAERGWSPNLKPDRCRALDILWAAADAANDTKRKKRIEATQKFVGCRHSRRSKD